MPRVSQTTTRWPKLMWIFIAITLSGCGLKSLVKPGFPTVPKEFLSTPRASYLLSEAPVEVNGKKLVEDTTADQVLLQSIQGWLVKQGAKK